jgi:hypothetical protein
MTPPQRTRLGASFHRSFSLRRNQIYDVLNVAYQTDEDSSWKKTDLRQTSSIGTRQAESAPRYAYGTGMLDNQNNLTEFGKLVFEHDPMLERPETLWLMHYYLSAPNGFGPTYWHSLVLSQFLVSNRFGKDVLTNAITEHVYEEEQRELGIRYAKSCANVFLKTYTSVDGLSALGILQEEADKTYLVTEPQLPPLWAFAVALLDYCQYQYPQQMTINLADLYREGGLTTIFMLGEGRFNRYLHDLQRESLVEVYRVAPPYQLVLVNPDPAVPLAKLYTVNTDDEYDYY